MTDERDAELDDVATADVRRAARPGLLDFIDRDFVQWRVTERDASADPGSRGRWCLVFSSTEAARRVWDYPSNWRTLSNTELAALSWGR